MADIHEIHRGVSAAIRRRELLQFTYRKYSRIVEPYLLGTDGEGEGTLVAWQVSGGSEDGSRTGWKSFRTAEIPAVFALGEVFETVRRPPDVGLRSIIEVSPAIETRRPESVSAG